MSDLRETLTAIYKDRGELTPQAVVDEARSESHPLHSRFEWDDEKAGEAYRRVQAGALIRSVKIVYTETPAGEKRSVRAFSARGNSPTVENREPADIGGYAPTEELVRDDISRKILLRELQREVQALQRKYGHLEEFAAIITSVAKAS